MDLILQVTPATILVDDVFPEAFETVADSLKLTSNSSNLLSVDQLLDMVWFPFMHFPTLSHMT